MRVLLLRNEANQDEPFATFAKREMATLTGAIQNSVLPLQKVVEVSKLPRAPGANSAFQASITWDDDGAFHASH